MRIVPIPCLRDNYAYLVICEATRRTAVVDPSESGPVLAALQREGVGLDAIWNTHHHLDHTGGNKELLDAYPELEVIGHVLDQGRIPGQTTFAGDGDEISLGDEVRARIIHNPGHTRGAISYYMPDLAAGRPEGQSEAGTIPSAAAVRPAIRSAIFTGDTLFAGGCGRLFEGTPGQMHASLSRLAELPEHTEVFCGHEYAAVNLRFAAEVEPGSKAVAERRKKVDQVRQNGQPTVPSTIAEERATNPFLRSQVPAVAASAQANESPANNSPVEIFAALRRWRDRF